MKYALILIPVFALLSACGPAEKPVEPSKAPAPVKWPEVEKLHEAFEVAHELMHEDKTDEAKDALKVMLGMIPKTLTSAIPAGVADPAAVKSLLETELGGLVQDPPFDPSGLDAEQLDDFAHRLHEMLAKLMHSAGMPHHHHH